MSDLRPNPFCGHATMRDVVIDDQHRDICCAVDCDLDMLFRMSDADWNTRPIEDALRAENERLRAAATEALAVLTRLADSAAYWSDYDVPVGLVAEIDSAKARLAGVLG